MSDKHGVRPPEAALMVLLGAIWGSSFLFMRVAAPEFGPISLILVRVSVASLFLWLVARAQNLKFQLWSRPVEMAIVGMLSSAIPFTLFAYGTLTLSAGFASVLNATTPFFGALISVAILQERLSTRKWIGLFFGFSGVCVLVSNKLSIGGTWTSIAACLTAACCYGGAAHYTKRRMSDVHPLIVATNSQIYSSILLLPLGLLMWPATIPSWTSWGAALTLGILCTAVTLAIYFYLLRAVGATNAMTIAYLIPLFGVLWGVLFLGETLTWTILLGGALIVAGLTLITRNARS